MLFSEVTGYLTKISLPDVGQFPLSYLSGRQLNEKPSTILDCQTKLFGRNPLLKTEYISVIRYQRIKVENIWKIPS